MAHSRLEKIGTIYTRITGIIKAGAMKLEDRPIWYEVYQAHPPHLPPRYDRPAPDIPVREIFYPEDEMRAELHKKLGNSIPAVNINDQKYPTLSQRVLEICTKMKSEKKYSSTDDAFNEALDIVKSEFISERRHTSNLASTFKEVQQQNEAVGKVNITDIFKDSS